MIGKVPGLVAAAISGLAVFAVLQFPLKIIVAAGLSFLTYLLYQRFVLHERPAIKIKSYLTGEAVLVLFAVIAYVFSLVILIGNSPADLFLNWSSISSVEWLRAFASILSTTFLPGYLVMCIVDSKKELSKASFLTFIPLISIFFTALLGFVTILLKYSFSTVSYLLVGFNGALLLSFLLTMARKKPKLFSFRGMCTHHSDIDLNLLLITIALAAILFAGILAVFFSNQSFLRGDMWRYLSTAAKLSNLNGNLIQNEAGRPTFYPYWFELYLASVFTSSNFPLVNITLLLVGLNVFSFIAFYSLAKNFFKSIDSAIFSTVIWSLFSGLGWLFVVSPLLQSKANSTQSWYAILSTAVSAVPWSISKPFGFWVNDLSGEAAIAFISLLMLLSIALASNISIKKACFLTALVVALSYLVHVFEAGVFVLILWPFVALFSHRRSDRENLYVSLSILTGLLFVYLINSISIYPYYASTFLFYFIIFSAATTIFIAIKAKIFAFFVTKWNNCGKKIRSVEIRRAIIVALFISYFAAIVVYALSNFSYSGYMLQERVVPWYLYPLKLGTAGFIVAIGLFVLALKGIKLPREIKLALGILLTMFLFGILVSYVKITYIDIGYEEMRVVDEMFPFVALVAGWILFLTFSSSRLTHVRKRFTKTLFAGVLIALIIISGSLSTLLSIDYWNLNTGPYGGGQNISEGQLAALNFLRLNCPANATVATVPGTGDENLVSLVGLSTVTGNIGPDLAESFFNSSGPNTFYGIASTWNIQYLFLSRQGYQLLQEDYQNSFIYQEGLSSFPVCFNSSDTTIYKIVIPSKYASLGYGTTCLNMTLIGDDKLSGNFYSLSPESVSTAAPIFQKPLNAGLIDLASSKNPTLDGNPISLPAIDNVTITNISFTSSFASMIETNKVEIDSAQEETYVELQLPELFNFTLVSPTSGAATIDFNDSSGMHSIEITGGSVSIDQLQDSSFIVGNTPILVEVKGTSYLNNPISYWSQSLRSTFNILGPLSFEQATVNGNLTYTIVGSDLGTMFINDFSLGKGSKASTPSINTTPQNHPSLVELESPTFSNQHLYLLIIFTSVIVLVVSIAVFYLLKLAANERRVGFKTDGRKASV